MDDKRLNMLASLEQSIDYKFNDLDLLNTALTHTSFVKGEGRDGKHNERLEFLGDAVLELCISEYIFKSFPEVNEGIMTRMRALAVYEPTLCEVAQKLDFGNYLLLSRGEANSGGRNKPSILSDALEAVIGAIYIDGGLEAAQKFILENLTPYILDVQQGAEIKDYKTMYQEYVQSRHLGQIEYILASESGPDHKKIFTINVLLNSELKGLGKGSSKQEAGQYAAKAALIAAGEIQA